MFPKLKIFSCDASDANGSVVDDHCRACMDGDPEVRRGRDEDSEHEHTRGTPGTEPHPGTGIPEAGLLPIEAAQDPVAGLDGGFSPRWRDLSTHAEARTPVVCRSIQSGIVRHGMRLRSGLGLFCCRSLL